MKYQIVVDSAADIREDYLTNKNIKLKVVPLTIRVSEKEFVDNKDLDIKNMLAEMKAYSGKSSTACPSPGDFAECYKDAEYTFVVTLTSKLSGTYNSAVVGISMAENKNNIYVIDSKAVSGSEVLIVDRLVELIERGLEFNKIVKEIETYRDTLHLSFVLQSFDNLIKNGRMNKLVGLIAGVLGIKPLCIAQDGDIKIYEKIRTAKISLNRLVALIGEQLQRTDDRVCIISHCEGADEAEYVRAQIAGKYKFKEIRVIAMKGLSSFYALNKGVIVCY